MPRKVDLLSYLPPVVGNTLELGQIAQAEEPELNLLYEEAAQALSDNFILTAGINGMKRYERLLGIKPEAGASLEERRVQVQIAWNQQLPYTLKRLTEQLTSWVGENGYELDASRFREYILDIMMFEQSLRVLHYVKNMVRQIIPANLALSYQGVYREAVETEISYKEKIGLNTRFYPRKNLERLLLDNTWKLDGALKLTGYGTGELEDFYPMGLRAGTRIEKEIFYIIKTGITIPLYGHPEKSVSILFHTRIEPQVKTNERSNMMTEVNSFTKLGPLEMITINQLDASWKLDGSRRLNGGHEII